MNEQLVIVGRGKLAEAIARQCKKEQMSFATWDNRIDQKSIVLYCGSARLINEVVEFCLKTKSLLILLSTDVPVPHHKALNATQYVNTSEEVLQFIETVLTFARNIHYKKVSIIESHQSAKKDISGTARYLAKELGKSNRIISSIRDQVAQLKLGIPEKYLDGHAYHKVTFFHDGVTTSFEVLVLGREIYARGILKIVKELTKNK